MGSRIGILKVAAQRLDLPIQVYLERVRAGQKWCYKCDQWKVLNDFWADRTRGDGRKAVCKACDYARKNSGPSKAEREGMRKTGLSWCRQCCDWKLTREVHAGLCRPHANEYVRLLYSQNPRFRMARKQHAHSRKRGVAPIPPEAQEMLLEEFDGNCAYCGNEAATWDHVISVVHGGKTAPSNVVPACSSCNSSKKDRDVFEWLEATGRTPSERFFARLILAECGLSSA